MNNQISQKINTAIFSAFVYLLSCNLIFAQVAALLPNSLQQYFDNNGNPLSSGTVSFYYPTTFNFKPIWQDSGEATPWTNPITLDAAGRPPGGSAGIYGQGTYRQIVKDVNGNQIWDAVTSSSGSSGGAASTGDGDLVGTVKPWAGIQAPNQYSFAYGQQISRITFSALLTAITQSLNVNCVSSSNVLTGITDTTQINVGSPVEIAACVAPGTTVSSKTASTVTMSNPSSVSLNSVAIFFPFGNGNGTTTFTLPDFRGNVIAGRPNMGGVASTNLTNTYCANPTAQGAVCGSQSQTLITSNLPNNTINATTPYAPGNVALNNGPNGNQGFVQSDAVQADTPSGSGTGFELNNPHLTSASSLTVPIPSYTPSIQLNGNITQTAFSNIQPTITLNYIIKVTPDTNSAIATGVTDIGGMIGSIACGTGIVCTGNTISFGNSGNVILSASGILINPTSGTLNQGIVSTQTSPASGTTSSGLIKYNLFNVTSTYNNTSAGIINGISNHDIMGWHFNYTTGGPNISPSQLSVFASIMETIPASAGGDMVGIAGYGYSNVVSGGGILAGIVGQANCDTGCVRQRISGAEFDSGYTGGSGNYRNAVAIGNVGSSLGSTLDTAVLFTNYGDAAGAFGKLFAFSSDYSGGTTTILSTTADLFWFEHATTIGNVFNASNVTVSGNILNFPKVVISGAGTASIGSPTLLGAPAIMQATCASCGTTILNATTNAATITSLDGPEAVTADGNNSIAMYTFEPLNTATIFGVTAGNWAQVRSFGSSNNGLLIGTNTSKPIVVGTNNTEVMRIQTSGGVSVGTTTDPGIGTILANKGIGTVPTVVGSLPTCNAGYQGQRAFVTDQATAIAYHGAVTGLGGFKQGVTCDGTNWYQD